MNNFIITILLFSISILTHAGESAVPLQKGVRMASDDLVYGETVLSAREAQDLSSLHNVDLSLLQPKSNEIWSQAESTLDDQQAIELNNDETLTFEGSLTSNTGLYRFNAIPDNGAKIYTVHLDKTLHTLLLRKNLLRKLGYNIPAIKYLKKLFIRFNSLEEREQFLKKDIPENTLGASERWVKSVNELVVEIQDVAVTEPSETDFYNVAMGVPTQTINSRTLRSLLIPYSLADLYESINKLSWIDGKIDNRSVTLPHFTGNDFATTIEDAQWMLRKVNKLTRDDFKTIVDAAYFPSDAAVVLVEKLISRRNSLNRLFSEKAQEINFNQKISISRLSKDAQKMEQQFPGYKAPLDKIVEDGKILQKDFPGYASRFAYGDAETPFDQIRYYLYSQLQANVFSNLVTKFNSNLSAFDIGEMRSDFFRKQFQDGLDNFLKTGVIKPIKIDTWYTPTGNIHLILSRNVVLGNYLGTDNLVQLADTLGISADMGAYLGVENLGYGLSGSVSASTSFVRTYTHLKPVKNLKQSMKEPYKNMYLDLIVHSLQEHYLSLSELKNSTATKDEKSKKVQELLKQIEMSLDTGESFLITESIMPTAQVRLNFSAGLFTAGGGIGAGVTTIRRIQLYKKSPKVLQIYDDHGFVKDINISYSLSEYIPLIKVSGKYDGGNYNIKSYMVNLSSDLDENPNLYSNALGVYNVLKTNSFELLDNIVTPVDINASFKDRTLGFSLLFWKMKSIKGKTYFNLNAKNGINGNYFSLNKDFMNGINIESFSKEVANYYLGEQTKGNVALSTEGNVNPGDSFFGRSYTQHIRYEAEVGADKKFQHKFISLSDSKQGWSLSVKALKKMMTKVNEKFQTTLFDVDQIDFKKLRLFKVGYHINLYDRGIEKLNSITSDDIDTIQLDYMGQISASNGHCNTKACGDLSILRRDVNNCKKSKNDEERASCNVELIDDMLAYLDFKDFKQLIGENNLYVYGTIDGFRSQSEILNDTIFSNTVGKIGSKEWNGPLNVVRDLLGLSGGELSGSWMRDYL